MIERHLDQQLQGEEQARFQQMIQDDEQLGAQLALQKRIDSAVQQMFEPGEAEARVLGRMKASILEASAERTEPATARRSAVRRPLRSRLAIAAVLALGAVGVWSIYHQVRDMLPTRPRDPYAPQPWRSLETVYRDTVKAGFEPDWVCRTDEVFAETLQARFGQPLLLAQSTPDVAAMGWSYCNNISPKTIYLLARVRGEPVIVLIDRADQDKGQEPPRRKGLYIFRRQIGQLVLYELTPLSSPGLLDSFYIPAFEPSAG